MRITRESLLKIAHEAAAQRTRANREIVCVYLTGSLLHESPLLGGTADIDLVFVHAGAPPVPREVIRVNEDVHLDLAHYPQEVFHQPRHLRLDAWVGAYLIENPLPLYDVAHWFEFTQSSVAAAYYEPETIIQRVRPASEAARQAWFALQEAAPASPLEGVRQSLWIMEKAANAVAGLSGPPLTERRFLLAYPQRAAALGRPGLAAGLVDLFMPGKPDADSWQSWLAAWKQAFSAAGRQSASPVRLSAPRLHYYERAMLTLWDVDPAAALWNLLRTWTQAVQTCGAGEHLAAWQSAVDALGLGPGSFEQHLSALDAYLDGVEETIDDWAAKQGV